MPTERGPTMRGSAHGSAGESNTDELIHRGRLLVVLAVVSFLVVLVVFGGRYTRLEILERLAGPDSTAILSAALRSHYKDAIPITIVEIDDDGHRAWGNPAVTPRAELLNLISILADRKPAATVVDIDLTFAADRYDEATAAFLTSYDASPDPPPLLLVRRVAPGGKAVAPGGSHVWFHGSSPKVEAAVARARSAVWVSSLVSPDDDWTFRDWTLTQILCGHTSPKGLPSVALAAAAAHREGVEGLEALKKRLDGEAATRCGLAPPSQAPPQLAWLTRTEGIVPIPYMFGWTREGTASFATAATSAGPRPLLMRLSAHQILSSGVDVDAVEGRVVLIGATHMDSQDFHRTPLGTMPGTYILANTVAGAPGLVTARVPVFTQIALLALPLFLVAIAAFAVLRPAIAVIVLCVASLSFVLSGIWFGLSASVIHNSVVAGVGALLLFLWLKSLAAVVLDASLARRASAKLSDMVLSDFGRRLLQARDKGAE